MIQLNFWARLSLSGESISPLGTSLYCSATNESCPNGYRRGNNGKPSSQFHKSSKFQHGLTRFKAKNGLFCLSAFGKLSYQKTPHTQYLQWMRVVVTLEIHPTQPTENLSLSKLKFFLRSLASSWTNFDSSRSVSRQINNCAQVFPRCSGRVETNAKKSENFPALYNHYLILPGRAPVLFEGRRKSVSNGEM